MQCHINNNFERTRHPEKHKIQRGTKYKENEMYKILPRKSRNIGYSISLKDGSLREGICYKLNSFFVLL